MKIPLDVKPQTDVVRPQCDDAGGTPEAPVVLDPPVIEEVNDMTELTEEQVESIAEQVAQQAAQGVAAQAAAQAAQQVAEQIGQAVSQAISKAMQTQTQTTGASTTQTRVENADIGGAERLEKDQMNDSGLLFANSKRTYDEYQGVSLEQIRQNQTYVNKVLSDALQFDNQRQVTANAALVHAEENANMLAKQAIGHRDIAIDRTWNVDEQGYLVNEILRNQTFKDAIAAAVADALTASIPVIIEKIQSAPAR